MKKRMYSKKDCQKDDLLHMRFWFMTIESLQNVNSILKHDF